MRHTKQEDSKTRYGLPHAEVGSVEWSLRYRRRDSTMPLLAVNHGCAVSSSDA